MTCVPIYCFQIEESYKSRESSIKKCIAKVSSDVRGLRQSKIDNPDDGVVLRKLRKEQMKVCMKTLFLKMPCVVCMEENVRLNAGCFLGLPIFMLVNKLMSVHVSGMYY